MTRSIQPVEPDVERMDIAMQWLLRLRDDNATDQDVAEWLNWYESDERNTKAFDSIQEFWQQTGQLAAGSDAARRIARLGSLEPVDARPSEQVARHRRVRSTGRIKILARSAVALGIAASLILVVGVPLLWTQRLGTQNVSPAGNDSAHVRHTQLPDNSSVDLAANSSVAVEYTAAQRTLNLEKGEAFFSVAPNHQRPFVVKANGLRVRAVGTKFNVREADDRVIVTVAEGTVDVYAANATEERSAPTTAAPGTLRLTAGNEVIWAVGTGKRVVRAMDPERTLAWRYGRLEYIDEPLSAVVADINRYSSRKRIIIDPALAQLTYTGTVLMGSIDEWLSAMPGEFPIRVISTDSSFSLVPSGKTNGTTATRDP